MRQFAMPLLEAAVNGLLGFGAAVLAQMGIFPIFGLQVSFWPERNNAAGR